jgi:hypothetical protein
MLPAFEHRAGVSEAEAKLAAIQESIDKTACAEDALAEAVAESLQRGKDISELAAAWRAKQTRDDLIAEHALFKAGFARLQAKASGLEFQVAAQHAEIIRRADYTERAREFGRGAVSQGK